ncbi:hypothetical protein GCM10023310_51000 [Paenibacillus vulneris]|uniref:Fibronectin type-III domain-containing protein n=1 Tax=Paenibacillus vulneris TaxID=1133364 RepID=A0ABW3UKX7_9BACL|nr:hypothetical protein [Paenibacillus sp. 32352]
MKKLIASTFATCLLFASAVPAFAQDNNQAASSTIASVVAANQVSNAQLAAFSINFSWKSVPNLYRYDFAAINLTDNYTFEFGSQTATDRNITGFVPGKSYRVVVTAYDANFNNIGSGYVQFVASSSTTSYYINLN